MPGFDGTGPEGRGPMTGGGRGLCNPSSAASPRAGTNPPAANRTFFGRGRPRWGLRGLFGGRGFRGGRGRGRGRR
jgi:hypothetical protein